MKHPLAYHLYTGALAGLAFAALLSVILALV